jgi:hypothetical protein
MSAFVVHDHHINVLITWAAGRHGIGHVSYYWEGQRRDVRENPRRMASVLHAENVRSVNARYQDCENPAGFVYQPVPLGYLNITPIQIIKACHCLAYQSCESSDWEQTEAYAILNGIEAAAVRSIVGYDDAAWEMTPSRMAA